jgi:lipid-A-disaccharide synthase
MAVIFPFEVPIYQGAGLDVEFVGHPLLDVLTLNGQEYAPFNHSQFSGDPLIALLPGSREREIQSLLPEMLRAADILARQKPGAKFILPAAPGVNVQELKKFLRPHSIPIAVVEGQTYGAIIAADMVIVASGTATLETAILGKPMVIVYKVSPVSYWVGKAMVKVNWIGLANIVAGKKVVPELLQEEVRGERIAEEALRILNDAAYRREMVEGLAEVRKKLGVPGAAERVARMALEMIKEKEAVSDQQSGGNADH